MENMTTLFVGDCDFLGRNCASTFDKKKKVFVETNITEEQEDALSDVFSYFSDEKLDIENLRREFPDEKQVNKKLGIIKSLLKKYKNIVLCFSGDFVFINKEKIDSAFYNRAPF